MGAQTVRRRRVRCGSAQLAVLVAALAGCTSSPPVHVTVPDGPGRACAALHQRLPDDVDGRSSRATDPSSVRTAAWGSPAVTLRCGVRRPAGFADDSELIEVDGVGWFLDERSSAYVFTRVDRRPFVEVVVPASVDRTEATAPLVDLASAFPGTGLAHPS